MQIVKESRGRQRTSGKYPSLCLKQILISTVSRRGIGRNVVEEPDEILRVIYAHLVRTMYRAGAELDVFFPEEYDGTVYADFPPSTQGDVGWNKLFQEYMDRLYDKPDVITMPAA